MTVLDVKASKCF